MQNATAWGFGRLTLVSDFVVVQETFRGSECGRAVSEVSDATTTHQVSIATGMMMIHMEPICHSFHFSLPLALCLRVLHVISNRMDQQQQTAAPATDDQTITTNFPLLILLFQPQLFPFPLGLLWFPLTSSSFALNVDPMTAGTVSSPFSSSSTHPYLHPPLLSIAVTPLSSCRSSITSDMIAVSSSARSPPGGSLLLPSPSASPPQSLSVPSESATPASSFYKDMKCQPEHVALSMLSFYPCYLPSPCPEDSAVVMASLSFIFLC